jgi:hypothetical protein
VATAASGRDPGPATARAVRLNPDDVLVQDLTTAFRPGERGQWPAIAGRLRLPPA